MSSIEATPTFVFASDSLKGTLSSQDTARLLGGHSTPLYPKRRVGDPAYSLDGAHFSNWRGLS